MTRPWTKMGEDALYWDVRRLAQHVTLALAVPDVAATGAALRRRMDRDELLGDLAKALLTWLDHYEAVMDAHDQQEDAHGAQTPHA